LFSGQGHSGVIVTTDTDRKWEKPVGFRQGSEAPILLLAAHASVGKTVDLREYYPALRSAGHFRISWKPYGGSVPEATAVVHVAARKHVELATDEGTLSVEPFYDDAPVNVANFLDLAKSNFYRGLTFHRVEPGYMIQGGCPKGDGTGVRHDGKRIPAEFNQRPHERGSVSMALIADDPDSASSQFFICATRMKEWDGQYTVIGRLVGEASFATLDKLMAVPLDDRGRPRKSLYIRSIRLVDSPVPPPETGTALTP
jgi:cyclophilin family peptidyl-prolyl cis-trans isomerase